MLPRAQVYVEQAPVQLPHPSVPPTERKKDCAQSALNMQGHEEIIKTKQSIFFKNFPQCLVLEVGQQIKVKKCGLGQLQPPPGMVAYILVMELQLWMSWKYLCFKSLNA